MQSHLNLKKGFTLIELLIVIVIIGILAVAVLSAINPIEQINKAEDARVRSDSNELLNAYERYYTTHGEYPWGDVTNAPSSDGEVVAFTCSGDTTNGYSCTAANGATSGSIDVLVNSGELKPEFLDRETFSDTANPKLYLSYDSTTELVRLCFDPVSKAYSDKATKTKNGGAADSSTCPDSEDDTSDDCFICVPE